MKFKLMQIFYFLLFFSVLIQGVTAATGGGNVGTWYGYVTVDSAIVASDNTTVVSAYINSTSTIAGNTTVGAAYCELSNCTGFYYIDAQANEGENITFKICGVNASQGQQIFSAGPHSLLNLSINKSANGISCTYTCGCSGGYCVHDYCRSSSTYCGDGYCDTGESCTSDNAGCSSGYACTNGCVVTGGSGGGGGGGGGGGIGGGFTTVVTLAIGKISITIPSIATGKMANISIAKYQDIAFRLINISVVNSINNIKIIIIKLPSLPVTIPYDIEGKVYHYINIEKINITDSDINKVFIKFAVNKTWLTENGITFTNISLYRWANNIWNELPTTYLSEDTSEVLYQAESPGLSVFIIGTKGGVPEALTGAAIVCEENWSCTYWSECIDGMRTRKCADSNKCGTTTNKPSESQSCIVSITKGTIPLGLGIGIIVIAVSAIMIFIILKKWKFKKKQILRMIL
jgi:PGF-pre-PGF domain-containing protein